MNKEPVVSVIIASYNTHATIRRSLQALEKQTDAPDFEVVVVDSSDDGTAELIQTEFKWVRLFHFSERQMVGNARNFGIAQSQGAILAFTDADCVVDSDWLAAVTAAHRSEAPVIGGVVAHANPEAYIGWANYFCEYAQWLPQPSARPMTDVPGACYTLKRWAFEKFGPFLEDTYCSDTAFNWRLQQAGYQVIFEPRIRVSHISLYSLSDLFAKKFRHGLYFGKVRVAEKKMALWKRLLYALALPLLPWVLFYRRSRQSLRYQPYVGSFIKSAPLVWLALAAWSTGEAVGYLTGPYEASTTALHRSPILAARPIEATDFVGD